MPLLVIMHHRREPWSQYGIVRFSWLWDSALAVVIWMGAFLSSAAVAQLIPAPVLKLVPRAIGSYQRPHGIASCCLLLLGCLAVGFGEELVMRGYLLTQLERLLGSTWRALAATTVLFASYHMYQGTRGVVSSFVIGLVLGGMFCVVRRLWPVCLAHALHDFVVGL